MERAQKERHVAALHEGLKSATLVVVTHNHGMTVEETTELRRSMRAAGARFRVTKNRLARIAIRGTRFENLDSYFRGPTAVAYSDDPVAVAKAAADYAKRNDKLKIVGASLGTQLIDAEGVVALTKMPPIEELRAKILGLLTAPASKLVGIVNTPATQLVGVVQAPGSQLARVLKAFADKEQSA